MAISALNSTTLSAAITATLDKFTVASTTNISAGNLLICEGEAILVNSIPVSGTVSVTRGVGGTLARQHASGKKLWIGSPDKFKAYRDYTIGLFGDAGDFPEYIIPGSTAKDGTGNEYLLVDATERMYTGVTAVVSLDGEYTAAPLAAGNRGRVGIVVEDCGSSDKYVWIQVRGYHAAAQDAAGDSAATSASIPIAATSVSTPAAGMASFTGTTDEQHLIYGMWIVGAASSATTSATSFVGTSVPVFLHYPYVRGWVDFTLDPTS